MNRKPQEATGEIMEEGDYVNTPASTVVKAAATSDQKSPSCTQSIPPLAVCWAILLVIMSLRICFTSVSTSVNAKLSAEVQQLKTQNQQMETENQQLTAEGKNLTAKVQELEARWKQNISQAQMSVDLYCPIKVSEGKRKCNPCLDGWLPKPPTAATNCYAVLDAEPSDQRTWDSAQENCEGKKSHLAVIANAQEKTSVGEVLWDGVRNNEFWIGLRADNGKWKWVNGSELTDYSWVQQQTPTDGQCALFHKDKKWRSENCDEKHQWICQQKALTLT